MSINLSIYDETLARSQSISIDFIAEVLADDTSSPGTVQWFFKFTTGARDTSNLVYTPKIVKSLSDLALNKSKQSAVNTAADYTSIQGMIEDYTYDYLQGHTADQFSSGCTAKAPLKF